MADSKLKAGDKGKELLFTNGAAGQAADKDDGPVQEVEEKPWKVMIIDDDDVVHQVSLMVLADYTFEGQPVEVIQGYSGGACRNLMKKHPDTAVLLLDVVMETDTAGLDTVKYIREELNNHLVRIIIRTGQPGQAPEKDIMNDYDINGYESKTELTAQRLFDRLTKSLSEYRDKKLQEQA